MSSRDHQGEEGLTREFTKLGPGSVVNIADAVRIVDEEGPSGPTAPEKPKEEEDPDAPVVSFEYEKDEDGEKPGEKKKVPKAVYISALALLLAAVALALWINRASLAPDRLLRWVKVQVSGTGAGDGFPVSITGSDVMASNFTQYDGVAGILSDTSFTMLNSTGRQVASLQHSFNDPALACAYGNYLLFNLGSTGYILQSGADTLRRDSAERDILAGAVAQNGRYALATHGGDGASCLDVYMKDGSLQYHYLFARDYITAVALNYDAVYAAVCTVRSEKGEMVSKVTVLDLSSTQPVAEHEVRGNLFLAISWTENGKLYAVGDNGALISDSSDFLFQEYSYDGRQLTAYCLDANRAFISVSAYEHGGPSTILVFSGMRDLVKIDAGGRVEFLSVSGGSVGALEGGQVVMYDYASGRELARAEAGTDAHSIALLSERSAYVLGVSEIRLVQAS